MNDLLETDISKYLELSESQKAVVERHNANNKRSLESIEKQKRTLKVNNAKKRGDRPVDIAIDVMCEEIGLDAMSQKQLHSILIKRYLDGRKP